MARDVPRYLSASAVARELGTNQPTVLMWRARYPDTPEPDATYATQASEYGSAPLWLAGTGMAAWRRWHALHLNRRSHAGRTQQS